MADRIKQHWQRVLIAWNTATTRCGLNEPITVSRCSAVPLFILFIQSLIICLLESCGVALGIAGGVVQLVVTCLFLGWMILQLENADVAIQTHGMLNEIHHQDDDELEFNQ